MTLNGEEHCSNPWPFWIKSPSGGNFEVPTQPTLGMASQMLATISRLTGIYATSMKKESRGLLLCC